MRANFTVGKGGLTHNTAVYGGVIFNITLVNGVTTQSITIPYNNLHRWIIFNYFLTGKLNCPI